MRVQGIAIAATGAGAAVAKLPIIPSTSSMQLLSPLASKSTDMGFTTMGVPLFSPE